MLKKYNFCFVIVDGLLLSCSRFVNRHHCRRCRRSCFYPANCRCCVMHGTWSIGSQTINLGMNQGFLLIVFSVNLCEQRRRKGSKKADPDSTSTAMSPTSAVASARLDSPD